MRLTPFQYGLKPLGHWFKFESENLKGQWTQEEHLDSKILVLQIPCPLFTTSAVLPEDKTTKHNHILFTCKRYYIDCLEIESVLDSWHDNPTYTATTLSKEEIIDNHKLILSSLGLVFPWKMKMIIFPWGTGGSI